MVWWVEDDIRFYRAGGIQKMIDETSSAPAPCLYWFGYSCKDGAPRYGSHLVGVSKAGLPRLRRLLRERRDPATYSHLKGLDTWLKDLRDREPNGEDTPWIMTSVSSWAAQRKHERRGRR